MHHLLECETECEGKREEDFFRDLCGVIGVAFYGPGDESSGFAEKRTQLSCTGLSARPELAASATFWFELRRTFEGLNLFFGLVGRWLAFQRIISG